MNRRRNADYSTMYRALDFLMTDSLDDMNLYFEIGRIVCDHPEKGAAVIASEYLQDKYPDRQGFSPRNLRRMRMVYLVYADSPEKQAKAKQLSWTANVVILEGCAVSEERAWYLDAALRFGWTKTQLSKKIKGGAWREETLDEQADICYTEAKEIKMEDRTDEKNPLYMPRQHLQKSHGRVCHEGFGEKSGVGDAIPDCLRGHQHRGDRQSSLSVRQKEAVGIWDWLRRQNGPAADPGRLRGIRPADWDGPGEPSQYPAHLRRRSRGESASPAGVCRPAWPGDDCSLFYLYLYILNF